MSLCASQLSHLQHLRSQESPPHLSILSTSSSHITHVSICEASCAPSSLQDQPGHWNLTSLVRYVPILFLHRASLVRSEGLVVSSSDPFLPRPAPSVRSSETSWAPPAASPSTPASRVAPALAPGVSRAPGASAGWASPADSPHRLKAPHRRRSRKLQRNKRENTIAK